MLSLVGVVPGKLVPVVAAAASYPPVNVFVAYADSVRANGFFPNPWQGSSNVSFQGCTGSCTYDAGAIRIDNPTSSDVTVQQVTVAVGSGCNFALWPSNMTIPARQTLILTQEGSGASSGCSQGNLFDSSDAPSITCTPDGIVPAVNVTISGITTSYKDTRRVLNTGGTDPGACTGANESHQWQQVGGGPSGGETQGGGSPSEPHPTNCHHGAFPINCATGEFYHTFLDLAVVGRGIPLAFVRTYSSLAAGQNPLLGFGWTDNYNMSLSVDPNSGDVTIVEETGSQVIFTPVPSGFEPPSRVLATLVRNGDGTYTFTRWNGEQFLFSSGGRLLRQSDRNGYATVLAYNGSGQLTTVTDPSGRTISFAYTAGGLLTSVTDPISRSVSFTYDGNGNLATATDVNGGITRFTYDSNHLLLTMTDPRGGVVTNVYDASGRITSQSDPMNRTETYAYTSSGTTITDARGNVETLQFQNNELSSLTKASGTAQAATWTYAYDPSTLGLTSLTDPNNHTSTFTYDSNGNMLTSTDPLNRTATFSYDGLNDMTSVTDSSQVTTTFSYDGAGNLQSVSRPLTSTSQTQQTTFVHSDSAHPGDITSVVDPTGKTWIFTYDSAGDATSLTDALGNKTTIAYDAIGRPISMVNPRGNVTGGNPAGFTTTYVYDAFGDVTKIVDPLGHTATAAYDADGNRVQVTDALGHKTSYTYDSDNEPVSTTRADNSTQSNVYDANGNLTSQTNGNGNSTIDAYDALDRLSSTTDPLNRTTTYGYDTAGNLTSLLDASGQTTSYSYDAANQLTAIAYSDGKTPNVAYSYDNLGRRSTMTDGTGTTQNVFDSLNRLTKLTNGAGQVVSYGYDLAGRVTSLTYPNGQSVARAYDADGRLTSVTDWLNHTSTFAYDAAGNLSTESYANATQASYSYDPADQLNSIVDSKSGTAFASFRYTFDANGQVTQETSTGVNQPSQSYSYDQVNRLAGVNGASYGYDAADQIVKLTSGATLAYDGAGEVSSLTRSGVKTSFSYDPRGNRTTGVSPVGTAATYTYDQANRLTGFQTTLPAASSLISAGEYHSLAVRVDGTVWAWGFNAFGQLGNGTTSNSSVPVQVPGTVGAVGVAAGDMHSVLLKSDGTVWAWGFNGSGQLGNATTTNSSTPVPATGVAGVTQVAAGNNHTLARKSDGTVAAWGQNDAGQLGNGTMVNSSLPVLVSGLTNVLAVAGGGLPGAPGHSLALKSDGTVWAWGYNRAGQLGNGTTINSATPIQVTGLSGVTAVAANGNNSYALKSDGSVWAWGDNSSGQLGNGSSAKTAATPVQASISGATAIVAGGAFAFAVKSDGTAWAWGNDSGWQLGDGGKCGRGCSSPIQITALAGIAAMSGGYTHGLAITTAGNVEGWGQNGSGQLGNGTTNPSSTPSQASGIANVKQAPSSASYTYNGDSLRATKTVSGVTSHFAWDVVASSALLTDGSLNYVYGPGGLPVEQISSSSSVLYLHQDQLGSTRFLTDATGTIAATYGYDPYGNLTSLTGNVSTALRFAGQYTDAETGFQYLQARYYDALTGQFVSKDPLAFASLRPYGYAGGNPTNFTDPSGLLSWNDLKNIWKFLSDYATPLGTIASLASLITGFLGPAFWGLSVFFDFINTALAAVQAINDAAAGDWFGAAVAIAAGIAGSAAIFFKFVAKAREAEAIAAQGQSLFVYIRVGVVALLAQFDIEGLARLAWQLAKAREIRATVISKALDAIGLFLWLLHKWVQSQQNQPPATNPMPTPGPAPGPQPGPAPAPAC